MLPPAAAPQGVVKAIAEIEASLDDVVNHGSDDELFIASYLQGHFAVEARQLEMREDASLELLNEKCYQALKVRLKTMNWKARMQSKLKRFGHD